MTSISMATNDKMKNFSGKNGLIKNLAPISCLEPNINICDCIIRKRRDVFKDTHLADGVL